MTRTRMTIWALGSLIVAIGGCGPTVWFPSEPLQRVNGDLAFDMDGDGRADYWQTLDEHGRKVELRFDNTGDGNPDLVVRPDDVPADECLHVILVLDGVPFDVIEELYRKGRFRVFPAPSRVVSVFPVMTDLALARAFTDQPCLGYEAYYYDRAKNAPSNANDVYLRGANAPWTSMMDYRCSTFLDAQAYLNPANVWRHELSDIYASIRDRDDGTIRAYSVATAGLGTRGGRDAIVEYLTTVDRLVEQFTYERRGRIKFTLFADHGHDLAPAVRTSFRARLEAAGHPVVDRLTKDEDVFWPQYGLVSCGVFYTKDPEAIAEVLLDEPAGDLVVYPAPEQPFGTVIVVRNQEETARIRRIGDRFAYEADSGDPLRLESIRERLASEGKVAADGSVADRDWFAATADHVYPDPLWRIWLAFNGLVENPADVIVSLEDGHYCGSRFFSALVSVASTHGNLSRSCSVTFAMSNHSALPPLMRIDDLRQYVSP